MSGEYPKLESEHGLVVIRNKIGDYDMGTVLGVKVSQNNTIGNVTTIKYRVVDESKFTLFCLKHPDMIHSISNEEL
jgi:hypothetical protein